MPEKDRMRSGAPSGTVGTVGTVGGVAAESGEAGPSRRSMLRGAAGIGAAGLAAGAIGGLAAAPALAATGKPAAAAHLENSQHGDAAEPVVVHVRDARTGQLDVFRGTSQFRLTDPDLAARLLRAGQ